METHLIEKISIGIKSLIKRLGIYDEDFCYDDSQNLICSLRTLSDIKNGKIKKPNMKIIFDLVENAGLTFEEFSREFLTQEYELFEDTLEETWNMIADKDYLNAEKKNNILKNSSIYNEANVRHKQSILMHEGIILARHYKKMAESIKILESALKLTHYSIFNKNTGVLDLQKLEKTSISIKEARILVAISNIYADKRALKIYESLLIALENKSSMTHNQKISVISTLCLNMSTNLLNLDIISDRILKLCKLGLEIQKELKSTSRRGGLNYNIGRYYYEIGDFKNAKKALINAYKSYEIDENLKMAKNVVSWSKEYFNITI